MNLYEHTIVARQDATTSQIKQLTEKNKIFTKQRILYLVLIAISIIGIVFMVYMFIYKQKLNKSKVYRCGFLVDNALICLSNFQQNRFQ